MNIAKKKLLGLIAIVVAVSTISAVVTTVPLVKFGPWYTSQYAFDSLTGGQVGGQTRIYLAQDSLLIGDYVFDTLVNKVHKSTALASYAGAAGVVVGGARQSLRPSVASADVGTLAATAGQRVIVAKCGRAWVKLRDSVYAGNTLIPSTAVAGGLKRRTTAIDTLLRQAGRAFYPKDSGSIAMIDLSCKG